MPTEKNNEHNLLSSISIAIVLCTIAMLIFLPSCNSKDKKDFIEVLERDSIPTMSTGGIESFISDSGVIRYKIITEEFNVFENKQPSYWSFEKGIYLEQFDTLMNIDAKIKADTAYHYDKKKLWKLIGNVNIQNREGRIFTTDLLFWDQIERRVYTDRPLKVEEPTRITYANGLEANEQLTECVFKKISAIIDVDEDMMTAQKDSLRTDSVSKSNRTETNNANKRMKLHKDTLKSQDRR